MAIFQRLDGPELALRIRSARRRVLLCCPGFGDDVASALIAAHAKVGAKNLCVVVDGTDQAARLGYGHFDAVVSLVDAGIEIRLEPGLRLSAVVIDDDAWCFATPPLLVDGTMEHATAPNAMHLTRTQTEAVIAAMSNGPEDAGQEGTAIPEVGGVVASRSHIANTEDSLAFNSPQAFDVMRQVTVFNAFVEFVELELLGTQITRQRVQLPKDLLLAVSDSATRERLTTSFQLIDSEATIGRGAAALRKKVEHLRKSQNLHSLRDYGTVSLRSNRPRLEAAVKVLQAEVQAFAADVRQRLQREIDHSRRQLIASFVPALKANPPDSLLSSVVGKLTLEHIRRWTDAQLDRTFPHVGSLARDMRLLLAIKSATYETLNDPKFQAAVRAAYPLVDFDKPFRQFAAAAATEHRKPSGTDDSPRV